MKKLIVLLLLTLLLVVSCKTSSNSTSTLEVAHVSDTNTAVDVRLDGTYPDFTKDHTTDNMCWAIAVCNSLEYSRHTVDNRECVYTMRERFGNSLGFALTAYNWYMKDLLHLDPRDFYRSEYRAHDVPDFIANEIDAGRPVVLTLGNKAKKKPGHVVSVYGYREVNDGYNFYVVDGDDSKHTGILKVRPQGTEWKIVSSGMYNKFVINFSFSISSATL